MYMHIVLGVMSKEARQAVFLQADIACQFVPIDDRTATIFVSGLFQARKRLFGWKKPDLNKDLTLEIMRTGLKAIAL